MTEVSAALPPLLTISLFASDHITVNDKPISAHLRTKARALLAYLALALAQPIARTTLCDLLWSGYSAKAARASLRRALADLRADLAPLDPIRSDYHTVQLDVDVVWCDVLHFEQLLDECRRHPHRTITTCPACQARLRLAHSLYKADFLATLPPVDSPPFNAWMQTQRTRLAIRYAELQHDLCTTIPPLGNLPLPQTSLVGRTVELAHLRAYFTHPGTRGLTLVGFGGMGKTRLALALAEQVHTHFADGVWLVELGALPPAVMPAHDAGRAALPSATAGMPQEHEWLHDRIATTISLAVGFTLQGANRPTAQLTAYLRDKTTLLLLDTFEHLSPAVDLLQTLLQEAPRLRFLITSRHQLDLPACPVYPVEGLTLPPLTPLRVLPSQETITHYSALQLFVERAETAAFDLTLDEHTLAAISDLCRLVEGAPLALELAVALLETQRPAQILQAVRANYTALQAELLDLPGRQRSAEAVFRTSWRLLPPHEAQTLACCTVFRGGFTAAAAQAVVSAAPATLEALVQKSLLRLSGPARYAMHELVRQFASEQLAQDAADAKRTYDAHAAYFTGLLATWQPNDATEQQFRIDMAHDWENVKAAWAWAVATGALALLQQGVAGLAEYCEMTSLFLQAEQLLGAAIDQVHLLLNASASTAQTALKTLLAHLLARYCYFLAGVLGQIKRAQSLAEELVTLGRQLAEPGLEAQGYFNWGISALHQGDFQRQQTLLLQALPLARQQGDRHTQLLILLQIGFGLRMQDEYASAQPYLEEALALSQALGSSRLEIRVLRSLGNLHCDAGHFSEALACLQKVLSRAEKLEQKTEFLLATANIGGLAYTVGDYAKAITAFEQARQGYIELGDNVVEAQIFNALAAIFIELNEVALANEYCQRALASPAELPVFQSEALIMQGHIHCAAGEWSAAHTAYQAAYVLSQQNNLTQAALRIQTHLAAVAMAQGKTAAALAGVETVLANFATQPFTITLRPQELLLIIYQILVANQDPRAPAVLDQAWRLVQQHLAHMDDPQQRNTYLNNVPVNRTLARLV